MQGCKRRLWLQAGPQLQRHRHLAFDYRVLLRAYIVPTEVFEVSSFKALGTKQTSLKCGVHGSSGVCFLTSQARGRGCKHVSVTGKLEYDRLPSPKTEKFRETHVST